MEIGSKTWDRKNHHSKTVGRISAENEDAPHSCGERCHEYEFHPKTHIQTAILGGAWGEKRSDSSGDADGGAEGLSDPDVHVRS